MYELVSVAVFAYDIYLIVTKNCEDVSDIKHSYNCTTQMSYKEDMDLLSGIVLYQMLQGP